jgi:putative ABC transport system substrate-binding protein
MLSRRRFLQGGSAGLLVLPKPVSGQPEAKRYRIGLLSASPAPFFMEPFSAEFRDLGWHEGSHFTWERRFTGGRPESAFKLARELVDLRADVILTMITGNALAAQQASTRIPVVMVSSGYPVEAGLAESLSRPGRNVTGNTSHVEGLFGKYPEFLRVLSPQLSRLAVVWDYLPPAATTREEELALDEMAHAARRMGITVSVRRVRGKADVDGALTAFASAGIGALFVTSGPVHAQPEVAQLIAGFAQRRRIPTMTDFAGAFFNQGGLMAYSASPAALGRRAAHFVDRILRGANPGDLPIERPSKFDLIINLKMAQAIGLTIPQSLLLRADQLIE